MPSAVAAPSAGPPPGGKVEAEPSPGRARARCGDAHGLRADGGAAGGAWAEAPASSDRATRRPPPVRRRAGAARAGARACAASAAPVGARARTRGRGRRRSGAAAKVGTAAAIRSSTSGTAAIGQAGSSGRGRRRPPAVLVARPAPVPARRPQPQRPRAGRRRSRPTSRPTPTRRADRRRRARRGSGGSARTRWTICSTSVVPPALLIWTTGPSSPGLLIRIETLTLDGCCCVTLTLGAFHCDTGRSAAVLRGPAAGPAAADGLGFRGGRRQRRVRDGRGGLVEDLLNPLILLRYRAVMRDCGLHERRRVLRRGARGAQRERQRGEERGSPEGGGTARLRDARFTSIQCPV